VDGAAARAAWIVIVGVAGDAVLGSVGAALGSVGVAGSVPEVVVDVDAWFVEAAGSVAVGVLESVGAGSDVAAGSGAGVGSGAVVGAGLVASLAVSAGVLESAGTPESAGVLESAGADASAGSTVATPSAARVTVDSSRAAPRPPSIRPARALAPFDVGVDVSLGVGVGAGVCVGVGVGVGVGVCVGVGVGVGVGVLPTCVGPVVPGPQVSVLLDVEVLDELVTVPLPLVDVGACVGVDDGVLPELTQFVPPGVVVVRVVVVFAAAFCCRASSAAAAAMIAASTFGSIDVTRRITVVDWPAAGASGVAGAEISVV
jgi:hypothetical protein